VFSRTYCRNYCLNPSKRRETTSKTDLDGENDLISTLVMHLCQRGGREGKVKEKVSVAIPVFHTTHT